MAKRKYGPEDEQIDWTPWLNKLGVMSDDEIAALIPCSKSTVCKRRVKLRIPPVTREKSIDWKQWDDYLGTMTDTDLAAMIGCSAPAVAYRRGMYMIPAFSNRKRFGLRRMQWKD